ncbi:DUF6382 domain-containing protein [Muricomes intestini]|jgi:hypothetical protein|uniref:DUF6382 domain-containing protein n=1 Tax=Muricomes intestini TaxID=1796634 RepID=A0A4R3K982_9FIRM|nr:DUF6382 domain-containing protein [Muricomes intestini]TCS79459.1 hypothetical protein EDD59_10840 [Muricomes intestini]HAX51294.1 hypothetical protein [Lachnospiraceae bacterium]HCR82524.1 hypothetical protein [Lachnospiraceae bacterium]
MKTGYEKELNRVLLHVDLSKLYEEDYQIHMMKENKISGLLEVTGCGINGKSRYSYVVTGMVSMKTMFETSVIRKDDMLIFVNRLIEVVKLLGSYMLNPDGLLLYPEFVFFREDNWFFCYLPGRRKPLGEAFHIMTEYFVKKLDYEEVEGILLAYELHKATLQENYDLERIMNEYRIHEKKRRGSEVSETNEEMKEEQEGLPEENIFSINEEEYEPSGDSETIREMGAWRNFRKRTGAKSKKLRWGSWKDLITEEDTY